MKNLLASVSRALRSRLRLCAFSLAILGGQVGTGYTETLVRFAFAQQTAAALPVIVAEQRGFFDAEGLRIEKTDFNGGGAAVQSLAGGSSDLCLCAPDHALRLASRGLGGAVIVSLYDRNPYALVAKAGTPTTDLQSLRGSRLGVTASGSLSDSTLRYKIKALGFDPDTDYQIIAVGLGGPMYSALETGAIAAGMVTTPDTQNLLAKPNAYKVVEDFRRLEYPAMDLVAVATWLNANEATARAVARAVVKAEKLIQTDPTVVRAAIRQMFPVLAPDVAEDVARDITRHGISHDGVLTRSSYDSMLSMLRTVDPRIKPLPYDDVIKLRYLP